MEKPLDKQTVDNICIANGLRNAKELAAASIRQFVSIVHDIEKKTGVEYIRMEIGEPGLPAEQIGIEAEHEALLAGVVRANLMSEKNREEYLWKHKVNMTMRKPLKA